MGGIVCQIIINAAVRYDEVPQHSKECKELEAQLRVCYGNSTIAEAVGENEQSAMIVCDTLGKAHLTADDLSVLMNALPEYDEDTPGG